jgi:hypothetical protein
MPSSSSPDALAQEARFVFKGTVQKLKAATMRGIPVDDRTVVVRVDEVIHASEVLSHYAGQDITVLLAGKKKLKKEQQAVFYTNGLVFGDSVAVQALDYQDVGKMPAAMAVAGGDPVKNLAAKDIQARLTTADVIVSGRITSVRLPSDTVAAKSKSAGLAASTVTGRISEHDPDWRIGEIQVDQVHKGSHKGKTAEVRFPNSQDVMWHDAPKFHPGQEGFFILHKSEKVKVAAKSAPTKDAGDYVAFHSVDFQPFDEPGGIRNLIGLSD